MDSQSWSLVSVSAPRPRGLAPPAGDGGGAGELRRPLHLPPVSAFFYFSPLLLLCSRGLTTELLLLLSTGPWGRWPLWPLAPPLHRRL